MDVKETRPLCPNCEGRPMMKADKVRTSQKSVSQRWRCYRCNKTKLTKIEGT